MRPIKEKLLHRLCNAADEQEKISAVYRLRQYLSDQSVLGYLCATAVETDDYRLREALIDTLKTKFEESAQRFIDYAIFSSNPNHRRWALVNLSLMECRSAKEAVLAGLKDGEKSIRVAAAFNAGLYEEEEFQESLDDLFAKQE